MLGGMVVQIMIQAAVLRLILMLVAKHEADTSFAKAAMVAAGISVGTFLIGAVTIQMGPFVTIPVQIALMTAVLMTFCWISLEKSLIVVVVYSICHFLFAFLTVLLLGAVFKSVTPEISQPMPMQMPDGSCMSLDGGQIPSPEQAIAESVRLKENSDAKRMEVEARVREMEEGETPPVQEAEVAVPEPAPVPVPAPVRVPVPTPSMKPVAASLPPDSVSPAMPDGKEPLSDSQPGWSAARKALRIGGTMAGADGNIAVIDGKIVKQGDKVSRTFNGMRYRWSVKSLSGGRVDLDPVDAVPAP